MTENDNRVRRQRVPNRPGANVVGINRRQGIKGVQGNLQRFRLLGSPGPAPGDLLYQPVDEDGITPGLEPRQRVSGQARQRRSRVGNRFGQRLGIKEKERDRFGASQERTPSSSRSASFNWAKVVSQVTATLTGYFIRRWSCQSSTSGRFVCQRFQVLGERQP